MDLYDQNLIYEFHTKNLSQSEALKQYADHAVKEIKSTYGWDTDIQIHIEPEVKNKHIYSVTMNVYGLGEPIVVSKDGKQVLSVLKKVRKSVMRQIHRITQKRITHRKKIVFRQQVAS